MARADVAKMKSEAWRLIRVEHNLQICPGRGVGRVALDDRVAVLLVRTQLANVGKGLLADEVNLEAVYVIVAVRCDDPIALGMAEINMRSGARASCHQAVDEEAIAAAAAGDDIGPHPRIRLTAPLPVIRSPCSEPWTASTLTNRSPLA